jgi:rhodanese-related sulfurtransferase
MMLLVLFTACTQAADVKEGVTHLSQKEFIEKSQEQNTVIIDVRTEREFSAGHIAGALNIPHKNILDDIALLDEYKGKDIIFYCHSGVRARWVTNYLNTVSYGDETTLFHLKGDVRAWRARGLPLKK